MLNVGSKWAHCTCLGTPNSPKPSLEKHINPFSTDFWSQNSPVSRHFVPLSFRAFCDSGVAKMACNGLKRGSFHLFVHPKWSWIIFGKPHF